MYVEP
jgi:hypothetical protein